jgi:hypothetical protein
MLKEEFGKEVDFSLKQKVKININGESKKQKKE